MNDNIPLENTSNKNLSNSSVTDIPDNQAQIKAAEARIRDSEARLKEFEVALKEKELENYKSNSQNARKTSLFSLSTPLLLAIVGIAGASIGSILQGYLTIRLEREKFRAAIIQKATETGSQDEKANSLRFLVKTGIIEDSGGKIIEYADNSKQIPTLLPLNNAQPQQNPVFSEGWIFLGTYSDDNGWSNKTINISNNNKPEIGKVYSVIDDVYLRSSRPTDDNQFGVIVTTIFAGSSVQITEVFTVQKTNTSWARIQLTTSGNQNGPQPSNTPVPNPTPQRTRPVPAK